MALTYFRNKLWAPRNMVEQFTLGFCTERYEKLSHGPLPKSIEDARAEVLAHIERLKTELLDGPMARGRVSVSEIRVCGTWVGGGVASKSFNIYGAGRKTLSASITESYPAHP